jgi:hypothetical protein
MDGELPVQGSNGADNQNDEDKDPYNSASVLKLFESLCLGQYVEAQNMIMTQSVDDPINFLSLTVHYLSSCSKRIESQINEIEVTVGTLKTALSGPNLTNQYYLATETEFVLIANRILRELNEMSKKLSNNSMSMTYKQAEAGGLTQLHISNVSKEVVECILTLVEGRRDTVVHSRVLSVLQVSMLKRRLVVLKKLLDFAVRDQEELLAEGVEIMNVLLTLATVDDELKEELRNDEIFFNFLDKMGHVEIKFQGMLHKVYFLIPKMCRNFATSQLKAMWNKCLPRDDNALRAFQENSKEISDKMQQEEFISQLHLTWLFGSRLLYYAGFISYYAAILINIIAIASFSLDENGNVSMSNVNVPYFNHEVQSREVTEYLITAQGICSSYLLSSYIVLTLPVEYKKRRRVLQKQEASCFYSFLSSWYTTLTQPKLLYYVVYLGAALMAWIDPLNGPLFSSFHILSIFVRNETAFNIINAVIYPIRQLRTAGTVGVFLLYIFSMLQFYFFSDDLPNDECSNLNTCFVYTINWGMRSGGGLGDVLEETYLQNNEGGELNARAHWYERTIFDLAFFLIIIIILLNIVFGIIIDTFSDLRSQKEAREDCKNEMCYICGISRSKHDQDGSGFEEHVQNEHNKWHYLFYLIHCQLLNKRNPDEMNTYEQFVFECYKKDESVKWMPLGECVSLKKNLDDENTMEEEVTQLKEDIEEMKGMMKIMMKTIALNNHNGKKKLTNLDDSV